MKKIKKTERLLVIFLMLTGLVFLSFYATSCTGSYAGDQVMDAYEVRINGHADSAINLLTDVIANDPENAMAYYELSRAKTHVMLGGGNYKIDEIIVNATNASQLDPDNFAYAFFEAHSRFLGVYIDVMMGKEDVIDKLDATLASFERALDIDECNASLLVTLAEINSMIPPEMGGSRDEAIKYAGKLGECDPVEALRAYSFILPEDGSLLSYWLDAYETYDASPLISEELGWAYLLDGDVENGTKYIEEAISLKSDNTVLYLNLGRAIMINAMETKNHDMGADAMRKYQMYLNSNNVPDPMKAFTYRMMSITGKRVTGNNELAIEYMNKQKETDPFCSRAFGTPSLNLFIPPDALPQGHGYYSRPF